MGAIVGIVAIVGGFMAWAARPLRAFARLFGHERRLSAIESSMATRSALTELGDRIEKRADAHEKRDADSFERVNERLDHVAQRSDLDRVERNLTDVMLTAMRQPPNG